MAGAAASVVACRFASVSAGQETEMAIRAGSVCHEQPGMVCLARAQQRLRAARVRLVDQEVRGLVRGAVHVVDPVVFKRAREAVH